MTVANTNSTHGQSGAVEPLKWPKYFQDYVDDLRRRPPAINFSIPYFGAEDRAYRDVCAQIKKRTRCSLKAWLRIDQRYVVARELSALLARICRWPNDFFIPDDPFEVLCHSALFLDDFPMMDLCLAMIEQFEIRGDEISADDWTGLLKLNLGQVVDFVILRMPGGIP